MFSLRREDQENNCGWTEQSFLSCVPAGAEREKQQQGRCAEKGDSSPSESREKEDETQRAATYVEGIVGFLRQYMDGVVVLDEPEERQMGCRTPKSEG